MTRGGTVHLVVASVESELNLQGISQTVKVFKESERRVANPCNEEKLSEHPPANEHVTEESAARAVVILLTIVCEFDAQCFRLPDSK